MSARERKRAPYYAGAKHVYKNLRNRKERARLREALGPLKALGSMAADEPACPCCDGLSPHLAADAGPTRELEPFDHWAYD